jgi:hypothetical protein
MGFDSRNKKQIVYFSQCRLLFKRMDLYRNCQMLCYKEVGHTVYEWEIGQQNFACFNL